MREILIAILLAAAAPAEGAPNVVQNANWLKKPSEDDLQAVWPVEALRRGVGGKAIIRCAVNERGVLEDCKVISENPPGLGFGDSALLLSSQFVMSPAKENGKPVRATVTIPINFGAIDDMRGVRDEMVVDPVWAQTPTFKEMSDAYPTKAAGEAGHVVLRCDLKATGGLTACRTVTEFPLGRGFAKAAHSLTDRFTLAPLDDKHAHIGGDRVEVPFEFTDPTQGSKSVRQIVHPRWVRSPDPGKIAELYPAQAADAGVTTGRGTVDCVIDAHGTFTDCATVKEEPADLGFGASALKVASVISINPWTAEGAPAEGAHIRLPIRFNLHPDDPAPAAPAK